MRVFVKPLWNVRAEGQPERTTLETECEERRYGTGRGYCVTADNQKEALSIVWKYQRQMRHNIPESDRVQVVIHRKVPVLMDAPRW